jgi:hypothetical protein
MQRSPPADRHEAPDKESFRRPWVIQGDPSSVTTESKVLNLSEVKRCSSPIRADQRPPFRACGIGRQSPPTSTERTYTALSPSSSGVTSAR